MILENAQLATSQFDEAQPKNADTQKANGLASEASTLASHLAMVLKFSRLVSDVQKSEEVLAVLLSKLMQEFALGAALVLKVEKTGELSLGEQRGLSEACVASFSGASLGFYPADIVEAIISKCESEFSLFRSVPLIADGSLYGYLLVFCKEGNPLSVNDWEIISALADMAATSMSKAIQYEKLESAFNEMQEAQRFLEQNMKLRALGEMAAGITHDLKNILSPIAMSAEVLEMEPQDKEQVLQTAARIKRIVDRGLQTVERIRTFSHQSLDPTEVDILNVNGLVKDALEICSPKLKSGQVQIDCQLGEVAMVALMPSEFVSVLVNIIVNAWDAIQEQKQGQAQGVAQGQIQICTFNFDQGVSIEVSDTGPGIPESIRNRVFEPFFTTKGQKGTGLGLAMAHTFCTRHAGRIRLESKEGRGTKVSLWFPVASQQ